MLATHSASTSLQPMSPRSLAISPNLDALLEHEERVRGTSIQIVVAPHSQVLSSPVSPGNYNSGVRMDIVGGGLPPPPRGSRRPWSPRVPLESGHGIERTISPKNAIWFVQQQPPGIEQQPKQQEEEGVSSSRTNPYINPAPTLEVVGHVKETEERPSERPTSEPRPDSVVCPSSKTIVDLFSDTLPRNNTTAHKNRTHRHSRRLSKPREKTEKTMATRSSENVVLDIRRRSNDFIDIGPGDARRRRPLNSHDAASTVFIDFLSPTTGDFPQFPADHMLLTRASSSDLAQLSSFPSKSFTPKPIFSIPSSLKPSRAKSLSRGSSPHQTSCDNREMPLPPTTNFLDMGERSDLVKKSRKLTRVFGETPGGGDMLSQKEAARKCAQEQLSRTAQDIDQHQYTNASRRHSIPVTPDELSESFSQVLFQSAAYKRARLSSRAPDPSNELSMCLADAHNDKLGSRVSFIDLSDEEDVDDEAISPITFAPNLVPIGSHFPPSPSQLSLYEAMTPEQRTEEARRRKREKLAKLHRFLGSRVPTDLVLGVVHLDSSLPPIQPPMPAEEAESHNKQWLRRRRSSSAGDLPSWSDDVDRMKEELNGKEKAINVRRAQKMEKMFGVAPPQTLYHTRHSPSPSVPPEIYMKRSKSPPKPSFGGFIPPGEVPSPTYQQRNPNRSSYIKKPKKTDRPGTAESSRRLLPEGADCYNYDELPVFPQSGRQTSLIYHHYQHSLRSLGDILDRDDKESLAELHQYLNDYDDTNASTSPLCETPLTKDRRLSNASSMKSERRRSLPARTSMLSIASEYSVTTPKPEVSDFQVRRRRAAKLTQFFGVNYRELINDVLESLETGLEHERKRGTLRAEELADLLERLRKIKMKRKGFF